MKLNLENWRIIGKMRRRIRNGLVALGLMITPSCLPLAIVAGADIIADGQRDAARIRASPQRAQIKEKWYKAVTCGGFVDNGDGTLDMESGANGHGELQDVGKIRFKEREIGYHIMGLKGYQNERLVYLGRREPGGEIEILSDLTIPTNNYVFSRGFGFGSGKSGTLDGSLIIGGIKMVDFVSYYGN